MYQFPCSGEAQEGCNTPAIKKKTKTFLFNSSSRTENTVQIQKAVNQDKHKAKNDA